MDVPGRVTAIEARKEATMRLCIAVFPLLAAFATPLLCRDQVPQPSIPDPQGPIRGLDVEVIPGEKIADPFLGDWEGQWAAGWPRDLAAQVIPRGNGKYQINFQPVFDRCCPQACSGLWSSHRVPGTVH
jgi:hypothetical protein